MPDSDAVRTAKYFIGANTSRGFINYGDSIFGDLRKLYVIKGGPGTGKSTFMKRFAKRAIERGYEVEYYYCSSDPSSLDGVVIPKIGVGITDGTPPHICEARLPGAKEEYLNLGEFWNCDFLSLFRERIEELSDKKGRFFSSAYKYLSVCEAVRNEKERVLDGCYDRDKAERAVLRFMKNVGVGKGFSCEVRQVSAFSMSGEVCFDTYLNECEKTVSVKDKRGISAFIFDATLKAAEQQKLVTYVSYDALCRITAIAFPEKGIAVTMLGGDKVINTERFINAEKLSETRKKLRFLSSLEEELKECAMSELNEARACHFALEEIYREAMDFRSLEEMEKAFIAKVIK